MTVESIKWFTDPEFLRGLRTTTEAEVIETQRRVDAERGEWIGNQIVHHEPQEARH